MPTGLSESGEGGAWPRVCCYWTEVLDVAANQERGRLRRAEGGARVAIATGTPLGRARLCGGRGELEGTGADVGTGAKRGKAAVRRQGIKSGSAATALSEESLRGGSATPVQGPGRCRAAREETEVPLSLSLTALKLKRACVY